MIGSAVTSCAHWQRLYFFYFTIKNNMVHISQDVIINSQLQRRIPGIVDSSKNFFKKYSDVERYDDFMWLD